MCAVPILVKHLDLGGFRLLFSLCWRGRPGIGPKWANMVQNTTKVVILPLFGVRHDLRVPIRGGLVPILLKHPV